MFPSKLMVAGAVLLTAVLAAGTIAVGQKPTAAGNPPCPTATKALGEKKEEAQALQKAQLAAEKAADQGYRFAYESLGTFVLLGGGFRMPVAKPEDAYKWSVRWLNARLDLSDKKADRIAAFEEHIKRVKEIQKRADALTLQSTNEFEGSTAAKYFVAEAEVWLAKEKAK